jgi:serine/threonine protein kinase
MAERNNESDRGSVRQIAEAGDETDDEIARLVAEIAPGRERLGGSRVHLSDPTIPTIGTVLGETYRIVRPLADGGCGDVYVATHVRLGSEVAVKVLHPSVAGNAQALARLQREADVMSALRHPHIVQILDFNVTEYGVPYLVMELLEGRTLTEGTGSGTPFEPRAAIHMVEQIAHALAAAHAHGIVHLDLKPDNVILVSTDGRDDFVKVIDFGISQATWRDRPANEPLVTGTPEYMAPEQACGLTEEIDHRTDQFALASLSYWLLTGHEPFSGADANALLHQVMNETQQPPSRLAPWLGTGVDAVINRGMSKRSSARFPDVMAFADALSAAVELIASDRRLLPRPPSEPAYDRIARSGGSSERDTLKFIRKRKRANVGRMPGVVLFALAAAAGVWFLPATRTAARATWHRATAHARRAIVAVSTSGTREPKHSDGSARR